MPALIRFLLLHAAIGFLIGIGFFWSFVILDIGGLRTMIEVSHLRVSTLFLMTCHIGLNFTVLQIAIALGLLNRRSI